MFSFLFITYTFDTKLYNTHMSWYKIQIVNCVDSK